MSAAVSATSGRVADVSSDVNLNADADADCHDGAGAGPIAHEATPVTPAVDLEARGGAEVAAESESTSSAEGAHTLKKSAADADVEAKFCSETGIDAQGVTMIELRFYGSGFLRHQACAAYALLMMGRQDPSRSFRCLGSLRLVLFHWFWGHSMPKRALHFQAFRLDAEPLKLSPDET
eukprot:5693649-Pleurochrysis_carterae.AAC.6